MGVHGWRRFTEAIQLLVDSPELVSDWMNTVGKFTAGLIDKILQQVDVDAALFSEPIGGNHGPLISPRMYKQLVVNSFLPILQVLNQHGVSIIIYRTYANTRQLLPAVVEAGFNCLWACETNPEAMDYIEIRREFGKDIRLIGGIDSDSLRGSREEINRSVMEVAVPLLEQGGYIPLADGRVREDVPFENYVYYRRMLEKVSNKPE
jgi:uroporphyrinogen decarboxylase